MERLRIFDLSYCENEVSDLGQIQGGRLATGFVVSFGVARTNEFGVSFSSKRTSPTSAELSGSVGGGTNAALAAGTAGGVSDGDVLVGAFTGVATF